MSNVTGACRDISALTKNAQIACNLFLEECKKQGLNVLVTETYRSQARQDYLYAQGRTRAGNKVTWTRNSRHTSGRAWDICKNVKGQEYADNKFFEKCGEIAKSLGIIWGGDWKSADTPHFEISETWTYKGDEINMKELTAFKEEYNSYVEHTSDIINTMGAEIQSLKNIINIMGKELEELRNLHK